MSRLVFALLLLVRIGGGIGRVFIFPEGRGWKIVEFESESEIVEEKERDGYGTQAPLRGAQK